MPKLGAIIFMAEYLIRNRNTPILQCANISKTFIVSMGLYYVNKTEDIIM